MAQRSVLLTLLMAVRNGERHLGSALESVRAQSFSDFEAVIIDDGSTDGTPDILSDVAARDVRITVLRNDLSLGLTRSLNLGLTRATGKYVARMDADDLAHPTRLQQQIRYLERCPEVAILGTAHYLISEDGAVHGLQRPALVHEHIKRQLIKGNVFCHSSIMMRREILEEIGGYDAVWKAAQDYELYFRVAKSHRLANLPQPLQAWRASAKGVSSRKARTQAWFGIRARMRAITTGQYPVRYVWTLVRPTVRLIVGANVGGSYRADGIKGIDRWLSGSRWVDPDQRCRPISTLVMSTKDTAASKVIETLDSVINTGIAECEIIVVDQNPGRLLRSSIEAWAERLPSDAGLICRYMTTATAGLSIGRNAGVRAANGRWVLWLDDDVRYGPSIVSTLAMLAITNDQAFYGRTRVLATGKPFVRRSIMTKRLHIWNFDSASSVALAIRTDVVRDAGAFDVSLGVGAYHGAGEESDLILRLLAMGVVIRHDPSLEVLHGEPERNAKKMRSYGRGLGRVYRQNLTIGVLIGWTLLLKLWAEVCVRLLLILIARRGEERRIHWEYLRGFVSGLLGR